MCNILKKKYFFFIFLFLYGKIIKNNYDITIINANAIKINIFF